ncbi:hypothetical protein PQG02_26595 [Nostoc sp. UHCC 0926]|nr:hypothetical protein PQG02_26595 [Nostoc sp. UHCC 0926]
MRLEPLYQRDRKQAIQEGNKQGKQRLKILDFLLVHGGGLCLCSSEFHSPNTFQTFSIKKLQLTNYS